MSEARSRGTPGRRPGTPGTWLAVAVGVAAGLASGCGSDSSGPEPISVRFRVQPQDVGAGEPIRPAVEVLLEGAGSSARVALAVSGHLCGATLDGGGSRLPVEGVATFPDLAIDIPADGYQLEARVLDATATSTPFDVRPPPREGPVERLPSICDRADAHGDASALAWIPTQDLFWLADDNFRQVYALDRGTGAFVASVGRQDFLDAFPAAAACDDGDGDPSTSCSYVDELEVVAFDDDARDLYVFNTVSDPGADPPVDRGAVFRLGLGACRGCLAFEAWRPIPGVFTARAAVAIDGELYVSDGPSVYPFDFETGAMGPEALVTAPNGITGLAYRDGSLYVLTRARAVLRFDAETHELEGAWDLSSTGLVSPAGIEAVRDTVYVVEGEPKNPIFALRLHSNED